MKRSTLVRDHMISNPLKFTPDMDVLTAAHQMVETGYTGGPVVDQNGRPVGMLTEQDIIAVALQAYYHGTPGGSVGDRMTPDPATMKEDDNLFNAAERFLKRKYYGYPVVTDDGYLVGLLRRKDVLRALAEFYPK